MISKISRPFLFTVSCFALVACAANPKPMPQQLAPEPNVQAPMPDFETRVSTLEGNVNNLQTEMVAARPKLAKVDAIDRKFRELSLELDSIDKRQTNTQIVAPVPAVVTPVVKEAPKPLVEKDVKKTTPVKDVKKETPKQKSLGLPLQVQQVRIGNQSGKTRLVLDTTAPVRISYDVDNAEKLLIVTVPASQWGTAMKNTVTSNPLISAWQVNKNDGDAQLVLQLKGPVKVLGSNQLAATATAPDRVYLDLVAEK